MISAVDVLILMVAIVIASYLWVLCTAKHLTQQQIIDKKYPLWITLPSVVIYYGGGATIIYAVVLVILKLVGVL